jgi:hypothetical protein
MTDALLEKIIESGWDRHKQTGDEKKYCLAQIKYLEHIFRHSLRDHEARRRAQKTLAQFQRRYFQAAGNSA